MPPALTSRLAPATRTRGVKARIQAYSNFKALSSPDIYYVTGAGGTDSILLLLSTHVADETGARASTYCKGKERATQPISDPCQTLPHPTELP